MSQESERVYTINLGKVILSQSQHRSVRAINMIREFARHHMKTEIIKIEEDLAHQIWSKGVRSPPRKVKVRMTRTDDGNILVSSFDEVLETAASTEKDDTKTLTDVPESSSDTVSTKDEPISDTKDVPTKDTKDKPAKDAPTKTPKDAPTKTPKDTPTKTKDKPAKDVPTKTPKDTPTKTKDKPAKDVPTKTPKDAPTKTKDKPAKDVPTKTPKDAPTKTKDKPKK